MGYIDSINSSDFNSNSDYLIAGENRIINCSTDASVQEKTAIVPKGYTLDSNIAFLIKFTNGNTHATPTLNLTPEGGNALGAKNLVGNAKKLDNNDDIIDADNNTLLANVIYMCYYDGTKFVIDNNCTYHVGNSSNPHSVTKAQVGLGDVKNYSTLDYVDRTTSYVNNYAVASRLDYHVCKTPMSEINKTVKIDGYHEYIEYDYDDRGVKIGSLSGVTIKVIFKNGTSSSTSITLSVNDDGAYPIYNVDDNSSATPSLGLENLPLHSSVELTLLWGKPYSEYSGNIKYWRVVNIHKSNL